MRVPVGGNNRGAAFADTRCFIEKGGAKGQGLAAAAVENDGARLDAGNFKARHGPGIGPAPGFDGNAR